MKRSRSKAKGTSKEYKAIRLLRNEGYYTVRSAGSHGLWDIVAYNHTKVRFIQVKSAGVKPSAAERRALLHASVPRNCSKEIWTDIPRKGFDIQIL